MTTHTTNDLDGTRYRAETLAEAALDEDYLYAAYFQELNSSETAAGSKDE